MLNRVELIGKVHSTEAGVTPKGTFNVRFTVVTYERIRSQQTGRQFIGSYHKVVAWGQTAEFCKDRLQKDALVYVEGRIRYSRWKPKGGGPTRYYTEIFAMNVQMLDPLRDRIAPEGPTETQDVESNPPTDPPEDIDPPEAGPADVATDEDNVPR